MKTNRFIAVALATLFIAAFNACTKEETPAAPEVPGVGENLVELTLTATQYADDAEAEPTSAALKSTFNGAQLGWEADDLVAIYDGTAKRQFTIVSIEGGVATLTGMISPDATDLYAVFPYSAASDVLPTSEGQVSLNLPSVQTLAEGKNFDEDAFVTVGKVQDGNVVLKNAISVLKLNIPEGVSSVRLQGFAYENIAGGVYSSSDAAAAEGEVSSVILMPAGESFAAGEHYIALLPTKFTAGFKVVYSKEGAMAVVKTTTPVEFPRKGGFDITGSTANLTWLANPIMTEADLRAYFANQDAFAGETAKLGQNITLASAWTPVTLTGLFDGQKYTISGVNVSAKGNVGFFANVKTGAVVKNLTIEGTIEAVNPSSAAKSCVGFAGLVSGTVWNCVNKANITLAADIKYQGLVGGIAGNVISGGTVHGCTNKGSITTTGTAGTESWYIGGIAGYIGDPASAGWSNNNAGGTLTSCVNEGTMNIDNAYLEAIGGIVGMYRGGSITGCENKGSFAIAKTRADKGSYLGGVAGYIQNRSGKKLAISGCTNSATIDLTGAATTLSSVGGIVGMAHHQDFAAEVSECYNKGAISVSSTGALNIGGIVATYGGSNTLEFKFLDCHNQAPVSCVNLESTTEVLNVATYVGGIAGATGVVTKFESCSNSGAVSSNRLSKNYVGGIVGATAGTTKVQSSTNSGAVTANPSVDATTENYVGGIMGSAIGTVEMILNENTSIGTVTLAASGTVGVGGVVGLSGDASTVKLTSNKNRANVLLDTKSAYCSAGGVVGVVKGDMECSSNINFGDVELKTTHKSPNETHCGGIVGWFDMGGVETNKGAEVASLSGDMSFGHVKSVGKIGLLFATSSYNNYGKVELNNCIVGGYVTGMCGNVSAINRDNIEITSGNFASNLWSYYKGANTTFEHKGTIFGKAADYDK